MGDYSEAHVHGSLPPPTPTPTKKSNKIRDIVRLQQMLKKWKKVATTKNVNTNQQQLINDVAPAAATTNKTKAIGLNKFFKKTLSYSDISSSNNEEVRKGYLAVWVGRDHEEDEGLMKKKKFVIPTEYLAHEAFSVLLRDAEEEFGFQQEGILKIPCDVPLFQEILKKMMSTTTTHDNNNKKQRPSLKSSSSTSSFFLYQQQQQQQQHQQQEQPRHHGHGHVAATPPTTPTPTHHLPLYCR